MGIKYIEYTPKYVKHNDYAEWVPRMRGYTCSECGHFTEFRNSVCPACALPMIGDNDENTDEDSDVETEEKA